MLPKECFHSFEVGFGLRFEQRRSGTCSKFSFLRGRLRTIRQEQIKWFYMRFHSFEVGFGLLSETVTARFIVVFIPSR